MSRYLQFGSGPHHLPKPWENFDIETDIRKPLPFNSGCAKYILASHVIEHIPFADGLRFLFECNRVLEPNGVLRLSFPDVLRMGRPECNLYSDHCAKFGKDIPSPEAVWLSMVSDWGHMSCWTAAMCQKVLRGVGFDSRASYYGHSIVTALEGIDTHHLVTGLELARAETSVIEAVK